MTAFITTAAVAFGLVTLAHMARVAVEGVHLLKQPVFLITSVASFCIFVWAVILLRRAKTGS